MHEKLDLIVLKKLQVKRYFDPELTKWKEFLDKLKYPKVKITIGLIGKYVELQDAYKSILESFVHAGAMNECKVQVQYIHSEFITPENVAEKLSGLDGLLVAPGFGNRGIEGKITSIKYARETGLPFFGICLGMQMAAIEFARNILGIRQAHSTEMIPGADDAVIDMMEEQKKITMKGGTMRLGAYPCEIKQGSLAHKIYGTLHVSERHRHRYEFNPEYRQRLERDGLVFSGVSPDGKFVEMIELPREVHPWFVGCQFHPEYKSKPLNAHPLFAAFVRAAYENRLQSETSMEKNGEVDLVMHERLSATSGD